VNQEAHLSKAVLGMTYGKPEMSANTNYWLKKWVLKGFSPYKGALSFLSPPPAHSFDGPSNNRPNSGERAVFEEYI
jgi:hypothetical protein